MFIRYNHIATIGRLALFGSLACLLLALSSGCGEVASLESALLEEREEAAARIEAGGSADAADLLLLLAASADVSELLDEPGVESSACLHDAPSQPDSGKRGARGSSLSPSHHHALVSPSPDPAPESEGDESDEKTGESKDASRQESASVRLLPMSAGLFISPDPAPEGPDQASED